MKEKLKKSIKKIICIALTSAFLICMLCGCNAKSSKIPKVILDCDMGYMNDDTLALSMLIKAEEAGKIEIIGITLEGGNNFISADYVNYGETQADECENTEDFLSKAGRKDIPFYKGTDYPKGYTAENIGQLADFYDSLNYKLNNSDYGAVHFFDSLSDGTLQDCNDARDFLISSADKYENELVIIACGPVMNIARAVEKDSTFAEKVSAIYYMGGAFGKPYEDFDMNSNPVTAVGGSNITAYAEYNVCYDAASFYTCITAGFTKQYISPGETNYPIDKGFIERLKSSDSKIAGIWSAHYDKYIQDYPYWDPVTAAAFLNPEAAKTAEYYVTVNTDRTDERYAMTSAVNETVYAKLSEAEKGKYGKAFIISGIDGFWNYTAELLCG